MAPGGIAHPSITVRPPELCDEHATQSVPLVPSNAGVPGVSEMIVTLFEIVTLLVPKIAAGNAGVDVYAATRSCTLALTPPAVPRAVIQRWTTALCELETLGPVQVSPLCRAREIQ